MLGKLWPCDGCSDQDATEAVTNERDLGDGLGEVVDEVDNLIN